MAKITYVQPDGRAESFEVPAGQSVMEGAFRNDVAGIIAECGGACACGTCQVFIDPAWAERVDKATSLEQSMIDEADAKQEHLRLSCQIR
jgi:2Fe-2S ferredoxin